MSLGRTPFGSILQVNGHFLMAFLFGVTAWLIWPNDPEWWGLGLLSILLGAVALGSLISALRAMTKIYLREREIARIAATARAPISSDLANQEALKEAGMFND